MLPGAVGKPAAAEALPMLPGAVGAPPAVDKLTISVSVNDPIPPK